MITVRTGPLNSPTDDPFAILFPEIQKAAGGDSVLQMAGVLAASPNVMDSKLVLIFQDPAKPRPQIIYLSFAEVGQLSALVSYVNNLPRP